MPKRQSDILNYLGKPTQKQSRNEPQGRAGESEDDMESVNVSSDSDSAKNDDGVGKGSESLAKIIDFFFWPLCCFLQKQSTGYGLMFT